MALAINKIPSSPIHDAQENTYNNNSLNPETHEELVVSNLLQVMEEEYRDLTKEQQDAIIMLLIEHSLL